VFTGDFNDFHKIIENSAIETHFQVFTGDFNDFKELLTIQGLKSIFKFSLVIVDMS
jgi:ATP adenylyltransferase/5',5'''-P-1,P-4-tetraphosphate phosphorylase II